MTDVETIPMEVGVTVGEKISGVCEYHQNSYPPQGPKDAQMWSDEIFF